MNKTAASVSMVFAFLLGVLFRDLVADPAPRVGPEPTVAAAALPAAPAAQAPAAAAPAAAPNPSAPTDHTPQQDSDRIPIGASPVLGESWAPVTVVAFSDFECEFCRDAETTLHTLSRLYGERLRIVWKHNPQPNHTHAIPAAEAAAEAFAQGGAEKFWALHDLMFDHQDQLERPGLEHFAEQLHLDLPRFRRAMDQHTHRAAIDADLALLQRLGGHGSPNFYVNGANIRGAQPLDTFRTAIETALTRARTTTPPSRAYAAGVDAALNTPAPGGDDSNVVYQVPIGSSPVLGPANALVTVVVFSDFQCPFCGRVEPTLRAMRTRFGNDIRFVWKNEPLPFHPRARPSAQIAMEAFAQRGNAGFWRAHDLLFEHNTALEDPQLEGYARELGLDVARAHTALANGTHTAEIDADHALAQRLGVTGTPAFFINGRRVVGAKPEEFFVNFIEETRTRAQAALRNPGTTRENLYERLIATGATAPAADPAADENRVFQVRANTRAPFFGNANATTVIEHFSDFQCPFCNRVGPTVEQIRQRYGDRIRVVWRNFPLAMHPNANIAAEAAMEVFAQKGNAGFWAFHDVLFAHQDALDRAHLEQFAQEAHCDMARFRAAMDNHTHQAEIDDDMAAARSTGAPLAMPAFFIGGRFLAGALPFEDFQRRIDAALGAH